MGRYLYVVKPEGRPEAGAQGGIRHAVAIYLEGAKLGYIPREYNSVIAQLMYFGHEDVFEAFVLGVDPEAEPWKQVRVGVRVRDVRG